MKSLRNFIYTGIIALLCFNANAQNWIPLGNGMNGTHSSVAAFTVWNGNLIAGGNFASAGITPANNIAQWNGVTWDSLGSGTGNEVDALTVYNGNLIAGGGFTSAGGYPANYIAVWNGTKWATLGNGMNKAVDALIVYKGNLYAGGAFTTADGNPAIGIAEWNGTSWVAVGSGMGGTYPHVLSLSVYNGNLIAGGTFTTAGGNAINYIAEWNGLTWSALGNGLSNVGGSISDPGVWSLAEWNGNLYAGGEFTEAFANAGYINVNNIAEWTGASWDSLGSGMAGAYPVVTALDTLNNNLFAGGAHFTTVGGIPANNVAQWNGATWDSLSTGMNNYVYGLAAYSGNLIAGGLFDTAGGKPASNVAEWCESCSPFADFNTPFSTFCQGACTNFNNLSQNAKSYQWLFPGGNPASDTGNTPTVCYNTAGQYDVQLIASNGNVSDTLLLKKYITVNLLASAGSITQSRDSICDGSGITCILKTDSSVGSLQWQASTNGINFSTIQGDDSASYTTPDTLTQTSFYRLIANSGSCGTDTSNTVIVHIVSAPVAVFSFTVNGNQVAFNSDSSSSDVTSFSWNFGDDKTSDTPDPVHTYDSTRLYNVCLTVYNGSNCSFTFCNDIDLPTGINNVSAQSLIRIYPNPAKDELTVELSNGYAPKEITITDALGRTLTQIASDKSNTQINIHLLSAGIYFVKVQMSDGSVQVRKFVKE